VLSRKVDTGVMGVTRREYYARRAVECALAADQIPCDRTVLLHMAATYVRIAADVESRQASHIAPGTQSAQCGGERRCDSAKTFPWQ